MWFIGVEVEQETSAPPPKKNPGSAPATHAGTSTLCCLDVRGDRKIPCFGYLGDLGYKKVVLPSGFDA